MTDTKDLVIAQGLSIPADLADFYKENASVGSENLSGAIPQLKVTEANSHNEGVDGEDVAAGQFYYSPTKTSFKTARVSIMSISRGFYAMDNQKEPKPKFTQLVGGMLLDTLEPFVMFVSGTRLQNMWNFGKEIKPFTKKVPMFSFIVELGLEKIKTDNGTNHIVTYTPVRDEKGQYLILQDREILELILNGVESVRDMFISFIEQKEVNRDTGELIRDRVVADTFGALAGVPQAEEKLAEPPADLGTDTVAQDVADDVPF